MYYFAYSFKMEAYYKLQLYVVRRKASGKFPVSRNQGKQEELVSHYVDSHKLKMSNAVAVLSTSK